MLIYRLFTGFMNLSHFIKNRQYTKIWCQNWCQITMTDVAYYYIDELQALGDIPPSLQNYIDYEAYGRDLDMGGCFIETSRGMCEIPY